MQGLEDLKVNELMDLSSKTWHNDVIDHIIGARDMDIIKSRPIHFSNMDVKTSWFGITTRMKII